MSGITVLRHPCSAFKGFESMRFKVLTEVRIYKIP
jgi:hypothetical protein